MKQDKWYSFHE